VPTWEQAVKQGQAPWEKMNDARGTGSGLPGQGPITPEERELLKNHYKTYTEKQGEDINTQTGGRVPEATEQMKSGTRIGQAYEMWVDGEQGREEYLKAAEQTPLGDVEDPAQRLKALSFISQNESVGEDTEIDENGKPIDKGDKTCAGSSIVAAAFLSEGVEGLNAVVGALKNFDPTSPYLPPSRLASPEVANLLRRLETDRSGRGLTVKDIQLLQQTVTHVLNDADPEGLQDQRSGIANVTMDNFMERSEGLRDMFTRNGMEIEYIDMDGKAEGGGKPIGMGEHYVLKIKGQAEGQPDMIYDPQARRGGQIIDFEQGVQHYDKATVDTIGDQLKPYRQ
jgi:hypothetical protein